MISAAREYFETLGREFGAGWNRFWFKPSDPYPLGVIRLLTGLVALWLHATLLPDLARLFGAGGWISVEVVQRTTIHGWPLSYLNLISNPGELAIVHGLGMAILLLFTAGFWSRLTSILAFIVILSDIHRAPMLTTQVEPVVAMVMFYLCLGPSGASWSLDRWLAGRRRSRAGAASGSNLPRATAIDAPSFAATLSRHLMQVHLCLLYATMGTAKLVGTTWWSGMGVWWLAVRPESRLVDLTAVHPFVTNFLTHLIIAFELGFPILVWIRLARPLLLALALVVWPLEAILTGQAAFALMMLIANLSFFSPAFLREHAASCCARRDESVAAAA